MSLFLYHALSMIALIVCQLFLHREAYLEWGRGVPPILYSNLSLPLLILHLYCTALPNSIGTLGGSIQHRPTNGASLGRSRFIVLKDAPLECQASVPRHVWRCRWVLMGFGRVVELLYAGANILRAAR